ncbi:hypothetical protein SRHO_G00018440 [Serrasalmus rhombeus]
MKPPRQLRAALFALDWTAENERMRNKLMEGESEGVEKPQNCGLTQQVMLKGAGYEVDLALGRLLATLDPAALRQTHTA